MGYDHFTEEAVKGLDRELCKMLDWSRGRSGVPFVITRGLDTPEHNSQIGGVKDSAHLKGLAVDLRCANSMDRFLMVQALLLAGFKRIGIYDKHVHCDTDKSLPQNVIWMGTSH